MPDPLMWMHSFGVRYCCSLSTKIFILDGADSGKRSDRMSHLMILHLCSGKTYRTRPRFGSWGKTISNAMMGAKLESMCQRLGIKKNKTPESLGRGDILSSVCLSSGTTACASPAQRHPTTLPRVFTSDFSDMGLPVDSDSNASSRTIGKMAVCL